MKTEIVQTRISPELQARTRKRAQIERRSVSNLIRVALEKYMSDDGAMLSLCCDAPAMAMDGVRYCIKCGDAVSPAEPVTNDAQN